MTEQDEGDRVMMGAVAEVLKRLNLPATLLATVERYLQEGHVEGEEAFTVGIGTVVGMVRGEENLIDLLEAEAKRNSTLWHTFSAPGKADAFDKIGGICFSVGVVCLATALLARVHAEAHREVGDVPVTH